MYDPLFILLSITVIILVVVICSFLVALTIFLFTLKKTLLKLQLAIDTVEDTALRSLAPFLSFKAMFSDTQTFLSSVSRVVTAIRRRKAR